MFPSPKNMGWIEIIVGPMYSGKTEELIRRLRRAKYARQSVLVFKPALDNRFSDTKIVSRNQAALESMAIDNVHDIIELSKNHDIIGIDEVQFFHKDIVDIAEELANKGKRVVIAGLDLDYKAIPFNHVSKLMALAEFVTKTLAICLACGNPASRSQRLDSGGNERIVVGDLETYEARCRNCFKPTPLPPTEWNHSVD
jgi:thymidine kinase